MEQGLLSKSSLKCLRLPAVAQVYHNSSSPCSRLSGGLRRTHCKSNHTRKSL
jgi:hypothetical protein